MLSQRSIFRNRACRLIEMAYLHYSVPTAGKQYSPPSHLPTPASSETFSMLSCGFFSFPSAFLLALTGSCLTLGK